MRRAHRATRTGVSRPIWVTPPAIREKVETFDTFTEDNDPHGERDFGAFEHDGQRIFWKIDYYDCALTYGSENPADQQQTVRVITIMLASTSRSGPVNASNSPRRQQWR